MCVDFFISLSLYMCLRPQRMYLLAYIRQIAMYLRKKD